MTTAHPLPIDPDDTIPASRLMRERDQARLTVLDLRGLLAMAQTDRNRFERERDEARAALTLSRNTLDDLTDHAARQGAYIAKLQTEAVHRDRHNEYLRGEVARLGHQSHKRLEIIEDALKHDAVGMDCTECDGRGYVGGECEVPDDYAGKVPAEEECPEAGDTCFGGRAVR